MIAKVAIKSPRGAFRRRLRHRRLALPTRLCPIHEGEEGERRLIMRRRAFSRANVPRKASRGTTTRRPVEAGRGLRSMCMRTMVGQNIIPDGYFGQTVAGHLAGVGGLGRSDHSNLPLDLGCYEHFYLAPPT